MRLGAAVLVAACALASACAIGGPSTFVLTSASVDPSFTCPVGAADVRYTIGATVNAENDTSGAVTIRSTAARLKLVAVKGAWLESVGDTYDAAGVTFAPGTVAAGAKTNLKLTIPSSCSNGKPGTNSKSYGDYSVTIQLSTSAGSFSITSKDHHRIVAA